MTAPAPGATIAGKYVVHRRLGAGGYGAVYEAENIALGKRVAIKVIERRHDRSEEAIGRFRREARASARIESPNIVQVVDVGEDEAVGLYMVMELLRGGDLRHKLDRVPRLEVDFAAEVAHQIACGLAKAHATGVVHRDLKPANVFLHEPSAEAGDDDDRVVVKIVDFGVAKLLDGVDERGQPLTTAGKTVGTPQYMSPEQVQGHPYDHRADLWALGAVLYEMLAGRPAFSLQGSFQDTALAIVLEHPPKLRELRPEVPEAIAAVVERALAKDPADRFADATAFAEALVAAHPSAFTEKAIARRTASILGAHPKSALSPRPSWPTSDAAVQRDVAARDGTPDSRRRVGFVVALAVLTGAAAILVVAALRSQQRNELPSASASEPKPAASLASEAPSAAPPLPAPTPAPAPPEAPTVASARPSVSPAAPPAQPAKTAKAPATAALAPSPSASPSHKPAPAPTAKGDDPFGSAGVSNSF
ncbi:MAG: serine/threonine protein kinase [Deltaproteobacteria bacterium]|nr:serine/threonine protein kinase [Deltaproteobacteria bacterium]